MKHRVAKSHFLAPRVVLFDFDGTLADSLGVGLEEINRLALLFGYRKLDRDDPRLRTVAGMDFVKNVLGLGIVKMGVWAVVLKRLVVRRAGDIGVYPGWRTTLLALKKTGVSLGIVTSSSRQFVDTILTAADCDVFDFTVSDVPYHRKASGLKAALRQVKVRSSQAIYVGDERRDVEAAVSCGIPFVAVSWGKDHPDLLRQTKISGMLAEPRQLLKLVSKTRRKPSISR